MTRITLDADLRHRLHDLSEPVELCNEAGAVVARILPVPDPNLYENLEPQVSEEELRRRLREKGKTYTTAEVLIHLESL